MTETTNYNYDSHGNMTSKYTDTLGTPTGAASDSVSILKDDETSTVELYDYDGFDRMVDVHKGGITASYTYNAEGIRTSKAVNGQTTSFTLDGVNVVAETKNGQTTQYIRGLQLIESIDSSNTKKYYTYNGHGDVTNLTDASGAVVQTYAYDPFGTEIGAVSGDTNPFRYCGEYFDKETGDIYLRARYYSPSRGRFNAQDPAMANGYNWYVYAGNNPVNFFDPSGLMYGGADDKSTAILLQQVKKITGDDRYCRASLVDGELVTDENGCYIMLGEGEANIKGGSETARALVTAAIASDDRIFVAFREGKDPHNATTGGSVFTIYSTDDSDELSAVLVHETTHAVSYANGWDNIIFGAKGDDRHYDDLIKSFAKRRFIEAQAITVEEEFRKEMGYASRADVGGGMIGQNLYGQWICTMNSETIVPANFDGWGNPEFRVLDYAYLANLKSYGTGFLNMLKNNFGY